MKLILSICVLSVFCTIAANGFLFAKKFKDGCDPNPCKHKAKCVLIDQAKNKNLSRCDCPESHHGVHCEHEKGCHKNPCRKGVCTNDPQNLSNYTCKCHAGMVGPKCDTADACLKNPCKAGSVCSLDAKLKPVCSCALGMGGKACDKKNCTIVEFKGKNLMPKPKVFVDADLLDKFKKVDELAHLCNCKIQVSRSFSKFGDLKAMSSKHGDLKAMSSNADAPFHIGRGLDFEVHDNSGKLLCNKLCLGKIPIPAKEAKCFVDGLVAIGMKHSVVSPGIMHDGFHLANLKSFNDLRTHKQIGCSDLKN